MSGRIQVAPKEERTLDGILFASKSEMNRYAELKMLERAKLITDLELQPRFPLLEDMGEGPVTYVADFSYREVGFPKRVVEDVKGMRTDVYKMKKKLFLAKYPDVDFREVKA